MYPSDQRIVFLINSLEGGGAERVVSILLEQLENRLRQANVYLVLLDRKDERYPVPSYIEKITLDCNGAFLKSVSALHRCLKQISPTIVLSFLNRSNCANVLAAKSLGYTCILSERVNTSSHFGLGPKAWLNKALVRLLYPRADKVLAVSKGVGEDLLHNFGVTKNRLQIIYNPYDLDKLNAYAAEQPVRAIDGRYIISAGRLVPNKNFAMLIRAFQESAIPHKLVILGEGPEQTALQTLITELKLEDRVILGGFVDNPYALMARAEFAVFSSMAEGFPNAMAESMALSLPVIATDCDSGPAEILHNVIHANEPDAFRADYGILVPVNSQHAMARALKLMQDESIRRHYRQKSLERIKSFSIEHTVQQYFAALSAP